MVGVYVGLVFVSQQLRVDEFTLERDEGERLEAQELDAGAQPMLSRIVSDEADVFDADAVAAFLVVARLPETKGTTLC